MTSRTSFRAPSPRVGAATGPNTSRVAPTYQVLDTSYGYHRRGVASWYGEAFHGNPTSSGETYDMYQLSAAHRTLPLPSYVEVTNLTNERRVIVRVNDRGPFHDTDTRIIDVSYAAAIRLGMVGYGHGLRARAGRRAVAVPGARQPTALALTEALKGGPALFLESGWGREWGPRKLSRAMSRCVHPESHT